MHVLNIINRAELKTGTSEVERKIKHAYDKKKVIDEEIKLAKEKKLAQEEVSLFKVKENKKNYPWLPNLDIPLYRQGIIFYFILFQ